MIDRRQQARSSTLATSGPGVVAALLLCATAALALVWSHHKLFWVDELLVLETDSVGTLREVINIQRFFPVSLDPLAYHLLSHVLTRIFGATAFAIRLPSLLGFLIMQTSLFFFVRRIAGGSAGLIALTLPAISGTLYYAVEARPYGMLLGIFGIVLLSYQFATRGVRRPLALAGLALGLALAPNTHYFGVLLFVPIVAAEAVRTLQRRSLDWPVLGAIAFGMAGIIAILPLQAAVARFRLHYYNTNAIDFHAIALGYRVMMINFPLSASAQRIAMAILALLALACIYGCLYWRKRERIQLPANEFTLILILALLPVCGYLLARFVTHSMEVRYVLGAVLGLSAMAAIALGPFLRQPPIYRAALALLILGGTSIIVGRIRIEQQKTAEIRASLVLSSAMKAQLLSGPDPTIYFQEAGFFQVASYYEPDPEVRSHFATFYAFDEEMRFRRRETASLTSEHLMHVTALPTLSYEQLKRSPGPHHLILYQTTWDWSPEALARDGAQVQHLGPAFDGEATTVIFPPPPTP